MRDTGLSQSPTRDGPHSMRTTSTRSGPDGGGAELLAEYDARLTVAREEFDRHPAADSSRTAATEPGIHTGRPASVAHEQDWQFPQ